MQDYRKLRVWQAAHKLVLDVYRETRSFPKEEAYGLTAQVRRSAVSIPSNIAEGCGRRSDRDFSRFLAIAMGSAAELDYQLLLARDMGFLNTATYEDLFAGLSSTRKMLNVMMSKLSAEPSRCTVFKPTAKSQ